MSFIDPQSLARISMTVSTVAKTLTIGVKQPFHLNLPDASHPGSYIEKKITAPATIYGNGHASENFKLGPAGQSLATAWATNFPIFWYLCFYSGVVYWVASRNPCMKKMPASANNIGDFDAAPATSDQANVFVAASITEANFVNLPVWRIGSMPVQRSAAQNELDLVALTSGQDGFGVFQDSIQFTFPTGQNGADSGKHHTRAGGTSGAAFTTYSSVYYIRSDGSVLWMADADNQTANTGGANLFYVVSPYVVAAQSNAYSGGVIMSAYVNSNWVVKNLLSSSFGGSAATWITHDNMNDNAWAGANDRFSVHGVFQAY